MLRGGASGWRADAGSVSAEKGYLRETGNLLFHVSLVILLAGIAVGGLFGYTGKVVVTDGDGFTNTLVQYDSFNHGAPGQDRSAGPVLVPADTTSRPSTSRRHAEDLPRAT